MAPRGGRDLLSTHLMSDVSAGYQVSSPEARSHILYY